MINLGIEYQIEYIFLDGPGLSKAETLKMIVF